MKKFLLLVLVLVSFCSCLGVYYPKRGKGYGCKGRESWDHMKKRINKPY